MRTVIVLFIVAGLGLVFLTQKRHEQEAQSEKEVQNARVAAQRISPTPRPVSEHNWAKHALDRTKKVTDQVAQTRKEDGTR